MSTPITHERLIEQGVVPLGAGRYSFPEIADTVHIRPHWERGIWIVAIDDWCLRNVTCMEQLNNFYYGMKDRWLFDNPWPTPNEIAKIIL